MDGEQAHYSQHQYLFYPLKVNVMQSNITDKKYWFNSISSIN